MQMATVLLFIGQPLDTNSGASAMLLKCAAPGATSAAERGTVGKIKLNWKLTGQSVASYNFIIPKAGRGRPSNATGLHADPRSCVSALCFRTALRLSLIHI